MLKGIGGRWAVKNGSLTVKRSRRFASVRPHARTGHAFTLSGSRPHRFGAVVVVGVD
jgi:hypothetical protein